MGISGPLLGRFVSGDCSAEERESVRQWIARDASNASLVAELQEVWRITYTSIPSQDVDVAWCDMAQDLWEEESRRPRRKRDRSARSTPRRRRAAGWMMGRVVAVLAFVVALTVLGVRYLTPSELMTAELASSSETEAFITERGQRLIVRLNDGTLVRINAESRLDVPTAFGDNPRTVRLTGEAYFDVVRDTTRPFLISTKGASVEVLGTSFNVRAYPEEEEVRVAVSEGRVALVSDQDVEPDTLILGAKDLGIVQTGSRKVTHHNVGLDPYLAWTDGRLAFRDAEFVEVAAQLERWYDLDIALEGDSSFEDRLTATFSKEEELDEILESISYALNLGYTRRHDKVTFYVSRPQSE